MTNLLYFAPLGAALHDRSSWTSVGVTDANFTSVEDTGVFDAYGYPAFTDGSTWKLSFTMSRRDMRKVKKLFPRTRAEVRRAAMRSAYRTRRRHR